MIRQSLIGQHFSILIRQPYEAVVLFWQRKNIVSYSYPFVEIKQLLMDAGLIVPGLSVSKRRFLPVLQRSLVFSGNVLAVQYLAELFPLDWSATQSRRLILAA